MANAKTWAHYEVPDLRTATAAELQRSVRRAAKTANQRIRELEKRGYTGGILNTVEAILGRRRFQERPNKMSLAQLRREYGMLRTFISSKQSTLQGRKSANQARYETAKSRGFTGTIEEFYDAVTTYFDEQVERLFSSDIIYEAVLNDDTDVLDTIVKRYQKQKTVGKRGKSSALRQFLEKQERKREKARKAEEKARKSAEKRKPKGGG